MSDVGAECRRRCRRRHDLGSNFRIQVREKKQARNESSQEGLSLAPSVPLCTLATPDGGQSCYSGNRSIRKPKGRRGVAELRSPGRGQTADGPIGGQTMRLRFGDCVFDSDTREVFRGDRAVALSPKAFALLDLLIAARPAAVSKADIHDRLWPGIHVSEANLANLVVELRAGLGDDARKPRILRTVPRFGYAFRAAARPRAGLARTPPSRPAWFTGWPGAAASSLWTRGRTSSAATVKRSSGSTTSRCRDGTLAFRSGRKARRSRTLAARTAPP